MGMLLRRRTDTISAAPVSNGKPIVKEPKTKKLNKDPDYVQKVNPVNNIIGK